MMIYECIKGMFKARRSISRSWKKFQGACYAILINSGSDDQTVKRINKEKLLVGTGSRSFCGGAFLVVELADPLN